MNPTQIIADADTKFAAAQARFSEELKKLRTGRANAAMLDGIMVLAYGALMPLNQVATVNAVEAQLIQITPFDPNNLQAIASAIRDDQTLGLNPMDDGRVVRVPIPPLNEERRRDIVRVVGGKQEEALIGLRGVRHDALDAIGKLKKDKEIGEDDAKRYEKQVDDAMANAKATVESAAKAKEQEIMTL
ncbi:MAG: ribosome recycling factor [Candidatus Saccharimonadales bacterium]